MSCGTYVSAGSASGGELFSSFAIVRASVLRGFWSTAARADSLPGYNPAGRRSNASREDQGAAVPNVTVHDFRILDRVLAETDPNAGDVVFLGARGDIAYPFL